MFSRLITNNPVNLNDSNYKGRIKEVIDCHFDINSKSEKILSRTIFIKFDREGREINRKEANPDGSLFNTTFTYHKNRKIEGVTFDENNKFIDGLIIGTNPDGKAFKAGFTDLERKDESEKFLDSKISGSAANDADDFESLVKKYMPDFSDSTCDFVDRSYDDSGKIIEEVEHIKIDNSIEIFKKNYTYDPGGNKIEEIIYYGEDPRLLRKYTYKYDSSANVTEAIVYKSEYQILIESVNKHKFDSLLSKNWKQDEKIAEMTLKPFDELARNLIVSSYIETEYAYYDD
ncbi:MAG: hypothetical protein GY754_38925 [bacterium]|nr:hypothetical protein [bacterium]